MHGMLGIHTLGVKWGGVLKDCIFDWLAVKSSDYCESRE
jgi:hypothetical protein